MAPLALKASNVVKNYPAARGAVVRAVRGVSLEVHRGDHARDRR